jgi:hypothetical protein
VRGAIADIAGARGVGYAVVLGGLFSTQRGKFEVWAEAAGVEGC